jgi:hypothetical protein
VIGPPTADLAHVAKLVSPALVRERPGGAPGGLRLGTRARWGGGENALLVLGSAHDDRGRRWMRVQLPVRPNGRTGWISADRVRVRRTTVRVRISLSRRTVELLRGGRRRWRVGAVIGAPATPTPTGRFAISEPIRQPDPDGFLGPWALHLTAFSDVLDDYGGGPGRVAIHGRGGASLLDPLGTARSHGCIRISNAAIRRLAAVARAGTPVTIGR